MQRKQSRCGMVKSANCAAGEHRHCGGQLKFASESGDGDDVFACECHCHRQAEVSYKCVDCGALHREGCSIPEEFEQCSENWRVKAGHLETALAELRAASKGVNVGKCGCGHYNYALNDYEDKCHWHKALDSADETLGELGK